MVLVFLFVFVATSVALGSYRCSRSLRPGETRRIPTIRRIRSLAVFLRCQVAFRPKRYYTYIYNIIYIHYIIYNQTIHNTQRDTRGQSHNEPKAPSHDWILVIVGIPIHHRIAPASARRSLVGGFNLPVNNG